jgi:hypothetical protein
MNIPILHYVFRIRRLWGWPWRQSQVIFFSSLCFYFYGRDPDYSRFSIKGGGKLTKWFVYVHLPITAPDHNPLTLAIDWSPGGWQYPPKEVML